MANCCVCGEKIGMLESSELLDNRYSYKLCSNCSDMKAYCNSFNYDIFRKGYEYFTDRIESGISDSILMEILNTFLENSKENYNKRMLVEKEEQEKILKEDEEQKRIEEQKQREISLYKEKMRQFMCTTSNGFEGYSVEQYMDIYCGEVVLGTGFFSELNASVSDLFGGNATSYESKIVKARTEAIKRLKKECIKHGANAVLGVNIDLTTIDKNMIVVCASGTAVYIKRVMKI